MHLSNCYNFHDFRRLAKRRLPGPIFDYIDGAADEEGTYRRNTKAFETCDLVPRVLRGVEMVDLSVTVMGQKLALPVYCSPTALQRLFHHQGAPQTTSGKPEQAVVNKAAPNVARLRGRAVIARLVPVPRRQRQPLSKSCASARTSRKARGSN